MLYIIGVVISIIIILLIRKKLKEKNKDLKIFYIRNYYNSLMYWYGNLDTQLC